MIKSRELALLDKRCVLEFGTRAQHAASFVPARIGMVKGTQQFRSSYGVCVNVSTHFLVSTTALGVIVINAPV